MLQCLCVCSCVCVHMRAYELQWHKKKEKQKIETALSEEELDRLEQQRMEENRVCVWVGGCMDRREQVRMEAKRVRTCVRERPTMRETLSILAHDILFHIHSNVVLVSMINRKQDVYLLVLTKRAHSLTLVWNCAHITEGACQGQGAASAAREGNGGDGETEGLCVEVF